LISLILSIVGIRKKQRVLRESGSVSGDRRGNNCERERASAAALDARKQLPTDWFSLLLSWKSLDIGRAEHRTITFVVRTLQVISCGEKIDLVRFKECIDTAKKCTNRYSNTLFVV